MSFSDSRASDDGEPHDARLNETIKPTRGMTKRARSEVSDEKK